MRATHKPLKQRCKIDISLSNRAPEAQVSFSLATDNMKSKTIFRFEQSALSLALSNIFTIAIALLEKWNLSDVIWIYWGQSVVIGYYNWRRIRCLKQFSFKGYTINNQAAEPTEAIQLRVVSFVSTFFVLHYGLFHAGYLVFLYAELGDLSRSDMLGLLTCTVLFAVNHRFSFHQNLEKDLRRKPHILTVMVFPYARILPMHFTIIFGNQFPSKTAGTLILFLSLKTFADVIMHLIEHRGPNSGDIILN